MQYIFDKQNTVVVYRKGYLAKLSCFCNYILVTDILFTTSQIASSKYHMTWLWMSQHWLR